MSGVPSSPVSALLEKWRDGDHEALRQLVPLVYDELRRVAHHHLQAERSGHILQSTALVHEAYLRLVDQGPFQFENRAQFFAVASQLMRQVLVDYARSQRAAKRDGGCRVTLSEDVASPNARDVDLVALDDALNGLARLDTRQCRIVEMRYFGGLSIDETSQLLGVSPATVKREWATALVWLRHKMSKAAHT
jgi:RNA polymerase sigma factor (TIGR02999 family)